MWADETHQKYNTSLINLLRSSGVVLEIANTIDEANNILKKEKFDILIFDTLHFEQLSKLWSELFHDSTIKKIINTGEAGYERYKPREHEFGVIVVDHDRDLLKEIVKD
jgi:hypothetical protein